MAEFYNYMYDQYYNDVVTLKERYDKIPDPHVVAIYRGSLPLGVHLSNILKCPLSIVKYQSRDGEDRQAEWLLNLTGDKTLHPKFFPHLIVIDDIYDTGETFRAVLELPEFDKNPDYSLMALFGNDNDGIDNDGDEVIDESDEVLPFRKESYGIPILPSIGFTIDF